MGGGRDGRVLREAVSVRRILMAQTSTPRSIPFFQRALCLFLASLTACGTTRSSYVGQDGGRMRPMTGRSDGVQVVENWGAKEQDSSIKDPAIAPGYQITLHCVADSRIAGDYQEIG